MVRPGLRGVCVDHPSHAAVSGRRARSGYWAEKGGGMMIFQAASLEEARAIVAADPLVREGLVTYELHEWKVVVGDGA